MAAWDKGALRFSSSASRTGWIKAGFEVNWAVFSNRSSRMPLPGALNFSCSSSSSSSTA